MTSVLQTTAGKMIFGKYDERVHAVAASADRHAQQHTPRKPDAPVTEKTTIES